jgi:hypothetical protein
VFKIPPSTPELNHILGELNRCISKSDAKLVGPLIMKSALSNEDIGRSNLKVNYMQQIDKFVPDVVDPFRVEKDIYFQNCVHMQFSGKGEDFLYMFHRTIYMIKYENMLPSRETYTIFIALNKENDNIFAEIYIPVLQP